MDEYQNGFWAGYAASAKGEITTDPELIDRLREAAAHEMTPQEIWDQRVSWVYGQSMEEGSTREQVEEAATLVYGPRP